MPVEPKKKTRKKTMMVGARNHFRVKGFPWSSPDPMRRLRAAPGAKATVAQRPTPSAPPFDKKVTPAGTSKISPASARGVLEIADDFKLPLETTTQSLAVLGSRGAGKTYFASVLAEELLRANTPVVVIDPVGVFWGLRADAGGRREGLAIPILGGSRGDHALRKGMGKDVATWITTGARTPRSAVLDLSLLRRPDQQAVVGDFVEELYHRNQCPLHLIVEEADVWAPQRGTGGRALRAFQDLVRRGRVKGLGVTLITQRPATLHKDILSQASALVVLRITSPQDRTAIGEWLDAQADRSLRQAVLESLGSLPDGTAWISSPGWLETLQKVHVRPRGTWDSSVTPVVTDRAPFSPRLAEVDAETLRQEILSANASNAKLPKSR